MIRHLVRRSILLGTAALGVWASAVPVFAADTPATTSAASEQIETVTVTARKRSENAQDVPIAMSVLGGDQLRAAGVDNIRSLYLQVPDLKIVAVNPRNIGMTIRGLGATLANEGLVNSVGVFIDGVYYARPGASAFSMIDIDHVEVLRGPQGTLFGKNTSAGALNISTRKPTFDPEGMLEADAGNYGYWKTTGTISGPITDTIAGRLTASIQNRDGYVKNVTTGKDVNDFNDKTIRGQLLFEPNDDFSLRLIADYSFENIHCCVDELDGVATTYDDGAPIPNGFYARAALQGYTPLPMNAFARKTDIDSPQRIRMEQWGASAQADWNVLGHTLTSITAYRAWRFDPYNDLDLTGLPVMTEGAYFSRSRQFSQEVRIASPSNQPIEYTLGGYYFYEVLRSETMLSYGSAAGPWIVPTLPAFLTQPAFDGVYQMGEDKAYTASIAGFGQATWHITDALALTGGLRYTHEDKWGYVMQGPILGGPPVTGLSALIRAGIGSPYDSRTTPGFPQTYGEGKVSGTASVQYKFTDDIMGYATYARGYKSGGINFASVPAGASNIIAPELTDSYEIGLKSELFDRRLQLNLAAYWTNVQDYQSTRLFLNPSTGSFTSYVTNVGKLRSRGFEADAVAIPFDNLTVDASLAYTDAIYVTYLNAQCPLVNATTLCDRSGQPVDDVSKWALHFGANYQFPVTLGELNGQGIRPFANADAAYRSGFYSAATRYSYVPSYWVADLAVGLKLDDDSSELSFWVHNLFDKNYYLYRTPLIFNTGGIQASLGDPRTYGVTLRQRF